MCGNTILAFIKTGPSIIYAYFRWMIKYSRHPEKAPIEKRYQLVRNLLLKAIKNLNLDIKYINLNYMTEQKDTYIGLCNHRHFMDPVFFICASEKPISFVAKMEAFKIPFVGRILRAIDAFSIDREDVMQQVHLFKKISEELAKGKVSYYVFPEGTRMKIKEQIHTLKYKDGSIKPAYWAQKNILYAASFGSKLVFSKLPSGFKKRNITIYFHQPLKYDEFKDKKTMEIMPEIEKRTNETLLELVVENNSRNLK